MKEFKLSKVRENLSEIVEDVKMTNESVVIEKYNRPQAAIVSISEYKEFEKWELENESRLMKSLLKKDKGVRYDWEDVKEELFEGVQNLSSRKPKKVSKKNKK